MLRGSVTSHSSAADSIANTYTYDSPGRLTASTGSLVNPFQYTARESDTETGLYYYGARCYDPSAGRFLSEDRPNSTSDTHVFYHYASNNRRLWTDPTGFTLQGPPVCSCTGRRARERVKVESQSVESTGRNLGPTRAHSGPKPAIIEP
jgi:RHS repeat-associated protein